MKYGELRPGDMWLMNNGTANAAWLIFQIVIKPRKKSMNIGMMLMWATYDVIENGVLDFFVEDKNDSPTEAVTIIKRHE